MITADREGEWLASLHPTLKANFLASLAWELTVAARGAYEVQGTGLTRPAHLRQINEIQHRVIACLRQVLTGSGDPSFERSIAAWVLDEADSALREETAYSWRRARAAVANNAT